MSFEDFQKQINQLRAAGEAQRQALKNARRKATNARRQKAQVLRQIDPAARENDRRWVALDRAEAQAALDADQAQKAHAEALRAEWVALEEFLAFTNPIENISSLQDDCPILLFPLRLETRFKKIVRDGATRDQLWVRVFPDEIAVNSFESDLSEAEVRNARAYWLARWAAGKDLDDNRGAWRALAAAHGPGRAYWLTQTYTPTNLGDEPERGDDELILAIGTEEAPSEPALSALIAYWQAVWRANGDAAALEAAWDDLVGAVGEARATALVEAHKPANLADPPPPGLSHDDATVRVEFVLFPETNELETKLHGWSEPPTTAILPERFVFLAFQGDELALPPQLGNLVPPHLILGPDPAAAEGEQFRLATAEDVEANPDLREGDLIFAENMRWMFDFDEAVAKGMGFKINLTAEQATAGFDRVFVLGLKLSADRERGQALLEELFQKHHYSRKGLSILKQGTPTNNTEDEGAGYSWRHDPDDSFDLYFGESAQPDSADWFEKRDGRWLADILGLDPAVLQPVANYYNRDIAGAWAMQRALWPATMGHFMDSMMNPVFSPEHIEQTRLFFTRFVSGRGVLPAIRVGKQPYGILPATSYTKMEWFSRRSDRVNLAAPFAPGFGFLSALYRILLDMEQTWDTLQRLASHVGQAGDPHQILLDIVGLHPASVEIYKRYANSFKQLHNTYNALGYAHEALFAFYPGTFTTAEMLLARYGYAIDDEHPEPDIFKKSFFKNAWILNGPRIDTVPNSEVDPIRAYTGDGKNYIGWLVEAAEESHDRLRLQEEFVDGRPPAALLYLLLYHALDLSYIDASLKLHLSAGVFNQFQVQQAYVEPDFIHIETNKETESRWKYLYKSEEAITGDPDLHLGSYIPQHLDTLDEAAAFRDVLAGLRLLENEPTAALERLLMEHIDTVSYRLDAWFLGYLHLQLEAMRGLLGQEEESEPRRGIYIGAYGWLEDLRPENKELTPVQLPDDLDEIFNPHGDLVEDQSNAGYIMAPSLNHAVSAAVLRNGHLSNEDPEDKEELKIKLTSERVRQALQIIEGIQGGQTLSALLGYRFERGLHDRTDAEVDAFIFDLREKFPLAAKRFEDTTPGAEDPEYESIEQIEAKNVIDGVAFLEHIEESDDDTYPFGLDDLPTADPDQQTAIDDEVQALIELNDAVADLALAESVHQVVLGNYERASATLDTYSKGNFPPTPDVIRTPRSGVALTHRVALQLPAGAGHTLGDPGVTPRMAAEPAMHDWLSQKMPDLSGVVCVVTYIDRTTDAEAEHEISLADLGLAHIDALYLLNIESEQVMSALDDRVVQHILSTPAHTPRLDQTIRVDYTRSLDPAKLTVFAFTSLVASLRALLLNSKPLTPGDVKLANEASKETEQTVSLDPARVQPIIDALTGLRTNELADYIDDLDDLIADDDLDDIVADLDDLMARIRNIFSQAAAFGMVQSGIGFVYQWQQGMLDALRTAVAALAARWDERRAEYLLLRDEYLAGVGALPDEQLFDILLRAELKISATATSWDTPADYFTHLEDTQFVAFEDVRADAIAPLLDRHTLSDLIPRIQAMIPQLAPFDLQGFDIDDQLKQVAIFAGDLLAAAQNLSDEMAQRETAAAGLLADAAATGDAMTRVELIRNAAKAIFGDDFVLVPQFSLDAAHGAEWQNTLVDSQHTLRYLHDDLDVDFPIDDWLYSAARVREKLHHLENAILHIEAFTATTLELTPSQFPYREDDYWLGLQFPETKPGTEEPFTIDEDKLLFTSIYSEPFDPTSAQCGLLLDEWTEVIPSRDETAGLTFHYDQPNTEPPQTLLLVTPSRFTGRWQWQDLVRTLHETLDMARKRAVEPDHVDGTIYSRFLPPIVSLASPLPLTATLNLALNNQVFFAKVNDDE
ncbi:MAG TPA: hypothetical protein VK879_10155 [Candidatus Sulfomarinibacteraceae bacterium]|nr:hypothetical protein [Candidatus Sulfomarinibacteraceae bacterium]